MKLQYWCKQFASIYYIIKNGLLAFLSYSKRNNINISHQLFHSPTAIMTYAQELNPDCQVAYFQNCSRSEKFLHKKNITLYLLYEYVPIMEKTFGSGTRESCVAQRSIYVILSGNEETGSYINQVRIVLRLLLFCLCFSV